MNFSAFKDFNLALPRVHYRREAFTAVKLSEMVFTAVK
jgi:hypothetical protein